MRKVIITAGMFFLLALYNFSYAQVPESIGTVTFIEGICDIVRNNQEPVLAGEKEPVYVNDRIRTKSYSKLEITFADKSVLKLAPETCTTIEEYNLNDQKKREHSRIQLTRGKMEAVVSKTGAPDTFLIETPNAKGAVKGSDIFMSYLGGKTGVFVQEGVISIVNPAVPDIKTSVVKGNSVLVNFNEAPGEVRPIRDTELAYFKKSVEPAFIKKWVPTKGAAQMNGVVVSLSGTVRLYKKGAGDWREPRLNETVSEGDKLQTEEGARAEISLSNGNKVALQPYTEMTFDTLRYDSAGNYENTLAVTKGRLSAVVERTTKQLTFQVKTPTSVCGVRGTFVEVVVTPPAQTADAGAGAVASIQPTTQVFFEGGNGYVTSILTGQTQEIGAGQNALVDNLGKVSEPIVTPPEQRNVMLQTWTSAQTMGSYSTAEAGAGVATNTQQQPLPQAPGGPIQTQAGGEVLLPPLTKEIKDFLSVISTLTFDELVQNPVVLTLYNQTIPFQTGAYITMDNFQLTIKANETWSGSTSGTWRGDVPELWSASFRNSVTNDSLSLLNIAGENGIWSGEVSGSIYSIDPDITISGDISGTYTEGGSEGTFQGTASGTWTEGAPG